MKQTRVGEVDYSYTCSSRNVMMLGACKRKLLPPPPPPPPPPPAPQPHCPRRTQILAERVQAVTLQLAKTDQRD